MTDAACPAARRTLLAAGVTLALPRLARAAAFPAADIRIVSGAPPGGTSDIFSRLLAEKLAPRFRQRVVVENRAGAGGLVGAVAVNTMPADGHAVFVTSMGVQAVMAQLPGQVMPLDPDRDLTPISNGVGIPNLLIVHPRAPFTSVPELIGHAVENPGRLTYASAGSGGSQHLAAEMFKQKTGTQILGVPYRGGAPATLAVISGEVSMFFGNLPDVLGQVRQGAVRAMAVGSTEPAPALPDVLPMARFVPGFEMVNWFGLAGPRGMDRAALARWTEALLAVREDADYQRRMRENGMAVLLGTPAELQARIDSDKRTWGDLIRSAGLQGENA
jgi:tripartite-type tricarboxylate transporter receptor subunit TctC